MSITPYSDVNEIIQKLLIEIKDIFAEKLIGLYLYGSLVWGDFDHDISDIDMLVALSSDIDEKEFSELKTMYQKLVSEYPTWKSRIETQYLSLHALQTFKTADSKAATISPGEDLHIITVKSNWLMNWYIVRERGKTIYGPDPKTIIAPISKEEFIHCVRDHTKVWNEWVKDMKTGGSQAYAILTLCRAYYAVKHGKQPSKKQAAIWVQQEFPQWSPLIQQALTWRKHQWEEQNEKNGDYQKTEQFVLYIRKKVLEA